MRHFASIAFCAAVVVPTGVFAQSTDSAIKNNPGYQSGASTSGKSGMDSSRGVPSSPLAARPGTVTNGQPGSVGKHRKSHGHHG